MAKASRIVIGLGVIALVATTVAAQTPQTPPTTPTTPTTQTPPTTQPPQTPPTTQPPTTRPPQTPPTTQPPTTQPPQTPPTTQTPQTPQSTMQRTGMGAGTTTEQMSGEVVKVEGSNLLVKMSNGELRLFSNVPDSRMALIDGKEIGIRDLKPGTKLTATITKTATPVTGQTTTFGTGKVWHAMGTTVILALPNGEYKQYSVMGDNNKFTVDGKPATMYDLKPGMVVSGEQIVAEPTVEFASNARLVGQNPGSPYTAPAAADPAVAPVSPRATDPTGTPTSPRSTETMASASSRSTDPTGARLPSRTPDQSGAGTTAAQSDRETDTDTLPNTGSPVPLVGLLGLLFIGSSFAIRRFRR